MLVNVMLKREKDEEEDISIKHCKREIESIKELIIISIILLDYLIDSKIEPSHPLTTIHQL